MLAIIACGVLNPASYQLAPEFAARSSFDRVVPFVYGLWGYPVITWICAVISGMFGARITNGLIRKYRYSPAWFLASVGYFLCIAMLLIGLKVYQEVITPIREVGGI
jgi:hypothetical protein